jgi:hypothetical protein
MVLGACASKAPPAPVAPAAAPACAPVQAPIAASCAEVRSLQQRVSAANGGLSGLGLGLSARNEAHVVDEVRLATEGLSQKLEARCASKSPCVEGDLKRAEGERHLVEHLRLLEHVKRRPTAEARDAVVENALPGLVKERLALSLRVQARNGAEPLHPHPQTAPVQTGEELSVVVKPSVDAYLYVIHMASQWGPSLVFPTSLGGDGSLLRAQTAVSVPPLAQGLYQLGNAPGTDRLLFIASVRPLTGLEEALQALAKTGPGEASLIVRQAIADAACGLTAAQEAAGAIRDPACDDTWQRGIAFVPSAEGPMPAADRPGSMLKAEPHEGVLVIAHALQHE